MALTPAEKQRRYRERLKARAQGVLPSAPVLANVPPVKRWQALQADAARLLGQVREEAQAWYDERSEGWQESDKADAMQEKLDALEEALDTLQGVSW